MARKNQRIYTILGAAVGTGLAVYGIRRGLQWFQQQQLSEGSWQPEQRYRSVEHIPATGYAPAASTLTGMTSAERVNSDLSGDFDDRGTAFSTSELTRPDLEDETPAEIVMDEYVAPLIEHAIAFNSVMNLLRSRQREGPGNEGTESLTEGDRNSMRAVLNQMQEHVMEHDEKVMRKHPLAMRSLTLTRKLRDALDNITYSGTDLYRIQGEVRKDLCSLSRDLEKSGKVTITGLDQIRQLYECQ